MKRAVAVCGAVAMLLIAASAFAQAKPNFSGKWAPDTEKNAAAMAALAGAGGGGARMGGGGGRMGGGGGPMTITMDAAMLKIETTAGDGSTMAQTYKLDGSESKNMMMGRGGQMEQVSHAKIDGSKVVIVTTTANGDRTQSWYMDGDWLVREQTFGENAIKTYFKKAQ